MKPKKISTLSYQELALYTNNFCENNYISHFQFGKLYRGKIEQAEWTLYVLVKIWEVPEIYVYNTGDNEKRLLDEVVLLSHELLISHPGMIKLHGFCFEGDRLGAVYDLKPFDSVHNLIPKVSFSWLQRIKVALGLASLLKWMHTANGPFHKPFVVSNLDSSHILVDEDYNPKLCDFGSITGGIFPDRTIYNCHHLRAACIRGESPKVDVKAFGLILLNLISNKVDNIEDEDMTICWAMREFDAYEDWGAERFSLVDRSLAADPDFVQTDEHKISMLAIQCMGYNFECPSMKQVLRSLLKLKVVKKHAHVLGVRFN